MGWVEDVKAAVEAGKLASFSMNDDVETELRLFVHKLTGGDVPVYAVSDDTATVYKPCAEGCDHGVEEDHYATSDTYDRWEFLSWEDFTRMYTSGIITVVGFTIIDPQDPPSDAEVVAFYTRLGLHGVVRAIKEYEKYDEPAWQNAIYFTREDHEWV